MNQRRGKTSQFVAQLASNFDSDNFDLPGFPKVLRQLQFLLLDDNIDIREIANLINSDPVMTARLLRTANSAAFNLSGTEILNVDLAIARLGFTLVRSITLAFAMRQAQQEAWLAPMHSELEQIRRNSNNVAAICSVIAKKVIKSRADEAMLTGLVHQIGRLYILVHVQKMNAGLKEQADFETTVNDWYPTFTREILAAWQFPEAICGAVETQDALLKTPTDELDLLPRLLSAAKLSNALATDALMGEKRPEADEVLRSMQFNGFSFVDLVAASEQDIQLVQTTLR
ncbi:MAG: HDOD domain-containing protein [Proteobacteria bacterium]|nr:HDOD domain-containing protein [Pseudomonadota bacterium]